MEKYARYISASEGARIICEGAAIWAELQNMPSNVGINSEAKMVWDAWLKRYPEYEQVAKDLQYQAFDLANGM